MKIHNRVHKGPPLVPIQSRMHPVHIFLSYFPNIRSNTIFPSAPVPSKWSLQLFQQKHFMHFSSLPCVLH